MAKPFDAKAKAKRQKIIAGVLGLVLVGVLIFQAPTIMGVFGGGSSTASETATTPPPAPAAPAPAAPGTPAAGTPAPAGGGSAPLADSDPAPVPADGQLVTFDRFESKDPFIQQVGDETAPASGASTLAPSTPAGTVAAKTDEPEAERGSAKPAAARQPATQAPVSRTATIAVNGSEHGVGPGGSFPEDDPIFRLVSLKKGTVKVGIVGGGYANGSPTITLEKGGKPVTLMNTADRTTYVLRYLG